MKNTCLLTTLVLLVIITVCSGYTQDDVTNFLNWYRAAHGAGKVKNGLEYAAYEATNAVCKYGRGHHEGTEAEFASLSYFPGPCDKDQEKTEIEALKYWYSECPDYYGQGFSKDTGHFTHMVWKSVKNYGIFAQTCDIPNTKWKCAIALRTDGSPPANGDWDGGFSSNVGNVGQCANLDRPWTRSLYSLAPKVSSPVSPYVYGLNPFINNQHLSSAFPYLYNYQPFQVIPQIPGPVEVPTPVKVQPYAFKPTEAPVAPEGYIAPNNEGAEPRIDSPWNASPVTSDCLNYKGESVPCN